MPPQSLPFDSCFCRCAETACSFSSSHFDATPNSLGEAVRRFRRRSAKTSAGIDAFSFNPDGVRGADPPYSPRLPAQWLVDRRAVLHLPLILSHTSDNSFQTFFRGDFKNQSFCVRVVDPQRTMRRNAAISAVKRTYASLCLLPFVSYLSENLSPAVPS